MAIDTTRLEKTIRIGSKIIARCPACAELDQDHKGNHFFLDTSGHFGCVKYQGINGRDHRKRVFQLVGIKEPSKKAITIKEVSQASHPNMEIRVKDILGHIGRHFQNPSRKKANPTISKIAILVRNYAEISKESALLQKQDKKTESYRSQKRIIEQKEKVFSGKWIALNPHVRKQVVVALFDEKLLPNIVSQAIQAFNGSVISVV